MANQVTHASVCRADEWDSVHKVERRGFRVYRRGSEGQESALLTRRLFRTVREAGEWCSDLGYEWGRG